MIVTPAPAIVEMAVIIIRPHLPIGSGWSYGGWGYGGWGNTPPNVMFTPQVAPLEVMVVTPVT